jgi:hypothetical protein
MQNLIQAVVRKWGFTASRYVTNRETLLLSTSAMMAMLLVGCDSDSSDDDTNVEVDNNSDNVNELITINAVAVDYNQEASISIDDYVNITGIDDSATAGISLDYYLFAPNSIFNDDGYPDLSKIDSNKVFLLAPVAGEEKIEVLYVSGLEGEEPSEYVFNFSDGTTQIVISVTDEDDEGNEGIEGDGGNQGESDSIEIVSEDEHEFYYLDVAEMNEGEIFYVKAESTAEELYITFTDLDGATVFHGGEVVVEDEAYDMVLAAGVHTIEFNFVAKSMDYEPFTEDKLYDLTYTIAGDGIEVDYNHTVIVNPPDTFDEVAPVLLDRYIQEEISNDPSEKGRFISLDDAQYEGLTSLGNHCLAFLFASSDESNNVYMTKNEPGPQYPYQHEVHWYFPSDNPLGSDICEQGSWYPPNTHIYFTFYDSNQYSYYYVGRTDDQNAVFYDYIYDQFIGVNDESVF